MVKKLMAHVKEYKTNAILTPLFMLLEVAMEMVIPLMMASIIDDGVNAGNMNHIYKMGIYMILIALVGLFAGVMGGRCGAFASAGLAKNLRQAQFEKIQTYSFKNIDKFSSNSLITRLTTDVTNVQNAFQMLLRIGTRAPASLIVALILAIRISPKLSMVYVVALVFLVSIMFILLPKTRKVFKEVFEKYDELNESVQENVSAVRVVKAYVREQYETEKFHKASNNIYNMFIKAEKIMVVAMPIMMGTVYACILLISWFGAKEIVAGGLTTGALMSLLTYCMNILMSLMMLAMIFIMITMSIASAERIVEVLDEVPDISNPENPVYEVADGSIEFEHVNFGYHKSAEDFVLSDINLSIKSGETVGIIGGTGSAKTSLVNLISRLYDVSEGSVKVGGRDVREYDIETLRDEVAVVLQKNVLFTGTIYENLRWGDKNATDEECKRACQLACADEFIDKMPDGYNTFIEQGGTNVSGGQRQRLCIARALLKKPKVLILDDSTSAVDTATDAKIRRAFREEIPGTTKLIIAQRISSVQDADHIIVMDDGKINGYGTHEELLANNEIYRDVYESQNGAGNGDFDSSEGKEEA
ncbi:MAG: ABC transporter ATP-binding protein/permease [Lachnospiraceae bacterium]|nr:ABC transporter ATP-binding protein [Lachnospiraceae bacterium]MCR5355550.1 ABC transporter ATP-binding protein/permease [Lachnospiraceae bacterium]